jgi:hypothetical protein
VGTHYWQSGPDIAYQNLLRLFEHYKPDTVFAPEKLSRYFVAVVLHRTMLRRECGVMEGLTPEEIRISSMDSVEDFLRAFCTNAPSP